MVNLVAHRCPDHFPQHFEYFHFDLSDSPDAQILPQTTQILELLRLQLSLQKRTFVHCAKGISRAPTIAIAFLIRFHGLSFDDAFDFVRAKVSHAEPNAGFLMQLASLVPSPTPLNSEFAPTLASGL